MSSNWLLRNAAIESGNIKAWLLSAWSFSPYSCDWWSCSVDVSKDEDMVIWISPTWTASTPCICTHRQLSRDMSTDDVHDEKWCWAVSSKYMVSLLMRTIYLLGCFFFHRKTLHIEELSVTGINHRCHIMSFVFKNISHIHMNWTHCFTRAIADKMAYSSDCDVLALEILNLGWWINAWACVHQGFDLQTPWVGVGRWRRVLAMQFRWGIWCSPSSQFIHSINQKTRWTKTTDQEKNCDWPEANRYLKCKVKLHFQIKGIFT